MTEKVPPHVTSLRLLVSYRREDAAYGRRLHQELAGGLDAGAEVLSSDSVSGGAGWQSKLEARLLPVDVVLVVLGPASSGDGGLPSGQVEEVTAAFARGGRIIPVLVGGADLPADLDRLLGGEVAGRQAVVLSDATWDRDVKQLLAAVRHAAAQRPRPPPGPRLDRPAGSFMLPAHSPREFVDRTVELTSLTEFLAPVGDEPTRASPRVALVVGTAGIGKSALALQVAYQLRERFPDGQLYASLDGELGREAQVLYGFLRALGADRVEVFGSTDELAALYRTMLAGRRVLVVVDDVPSAEAARLLLPPAGGCAALLTSRAELSPLLADPTDIHVITLGALPASDAIELLRISAGSAFVDVSPQVAAELVQAVEGHPLALQLIAAEARRTGADLHSMLDGLEAVPGHPGQFVRGTLLKSAYERLPDGHRRLFRLLAVLPTPEFEAGMAAALAGIEPAEAEEALRSLVDSVLLEPSGDGRYRLGELVAGFAGERLAAEEPDDQRRAALDRAIRWIAVQTAFQPQAPITRDYWTADDTLGYAQYAEAIAAFIRHPGTRPPLTIGVKAPWGAGKTSLMRMVQERLDPRANRATWAPTPLILSSDSRKLLAPGRAVDAHTQVTNQEVLRRAEEPPPGTEETGAGRLDVEPPATPRLQAEEDWRPTVWFNPWMYQSGEQIWAGLANEIIAQITDRLAAGDRERFWLALNLRRIDRQAVRRRVYRLLIERFLPWLLALVLAGVIAVAGVLAALVVPPAARALRVGAAGLLSLAGTTFGVGAVIATFRFLREKAAGPFAPLLRTPDLVKGPTSLAAQEAKGALGELIPDPGYEARLGFLHLVQTDMRRVLDLVATEQRPLVVFVDDLDRCSPSAVAQVIEAINLFLAGEFPNCIFILAMEPAVVAAHVEAVYKDLAELLHAGRPPGERSTLGWRFLEKIVQLPLSLPPPDPAGHMDSYLDSLLDTAPAATASIASLRMDQPGTPVATASGPDAEPVATTPGLDAAAPAQQDDPEAVRAELVQRLEVAIRRQSPTADSLAAAALQAQAEVLGGPVSQLRAETSEAANRVFVELYSDREARAAIVAGVPGLASDNPREIKRFVNLFRFYAFIAQQHQLRGLPAVSGAEIAKLAVMAIRWPSRLDAFGQKLDSDGTTVLACLEKEARAAAASDQSTDDSWRAGLSRVGLVPEGEDAWRLHQPWSEELRRFLRAEPSIAAAAERLL
jgi:KAP family P-loop domain/NB-ARC domain/TIR domain